MTPPAWYFFLKIFLASQDLVRFYTNFRLICSRSMKNATESLIEITLNLHISLKNYQLYKTAYGILNFPNLPPCNGTPF